MRPFAVSITNQHQLTNSKSSEDRPQDGDNLVVLAMLCWPCYVAPDFPQAKLWGPIRHQATFFPPDRHWHGYDRFYRSLARRHLFEAPHDID